ncbi:MAG: hypothetical protein M3Q05_00200, partial [Bacteroidota bacterium]|nr:hypothetical protein [Bacteroidota bacterium]
VITDRTNQGPVGKNYMDVPVAPATDSLQKGSQNLNSITQSGNNQTVLPEPRQDSMVTSLTADSTKIPSVAEVQKEPVKSATRLALVQARLGLHSDFNGFSKISLGPTLELFLGRNVSLNTGLLLGSPEEKRLPFPRDFNRATGRRFEDQYHKHIPRNDRLQGIVVKTSVLRLPIGVNYYIPATEKLSFIAMVGTNLNLSVYQTVEFRSYFAGEEQLNKFETRNKPQTFNNLYFGVGLQYKFGRLVGQISPYGQTFFREPDYFNQSKKFGVNAALKFNLKK